MADYEAGARGRARPIRLRRSIVACLAGSVVLRCAESATGVMIGLYLAHIATTQYAISATAVGFVAGSAFLTELGGAPIFGALSDRWGRKVFILLGPLLGAVAVQMTAMTSILDSTESTEHMTATFQEATDPNSRAAKVAR